ncbi:MAG: hypothetical protein K6T37_04135 [Acidothermus cellulolyticus]|nr:hypothetical protein [Acidothermus cellulolyticus]
MTETTDPTSADEFWARRDELLAAAIRSLTGAARLSWPGADQDGRIAHRPLDVAEFVAQAVCGAAANVGGIETFLAGRPGPWEADAVRRLPVGTVGEDEKYLPEHRTEPLVVTVYIDEILNDCDVWTAYEQAHEQVEQRIIDEGLLHDDVGDLTPEREQRYDELANLEQQLEEQRQADWAAYWEAVKTNVQAAASRVDGLRVPVEVVVDLASFRPDSERGDAWRCDLAEQLLDDAIAATPLPGDGRPPLERLEARWC